MENSLAKPTTNKDLTCTICGRTAADVFIRYEHVGGKGDVPITQCINIIECWRRWDKIHYGTKDIK